MSFTPSIFSTIMVTITARSRRSLGELAFAMNSNFVYGIELVAAVDTDIIDIVGTPLSVPTPKHMSPSLRIVSTAVIVAELFPCLAALISFWYSVAVIFVSAD